MCSGIAETIKSSLDGEGNVAVIGSLVLRYMATYPTGAFRLNHLCAISMEFVERKVGACLDGEHGGHIGQLSGDGERARRSSSCSQKWSRLPRHNTSPHKPKINGVRSLRIFPPPSGWRTFMLVALVVYCQPVYGECQDPSIRPTLSSVSPETLSWEGGTLSVSGSNFMASPSAPPQVYIDGIACTNTTVHSDILITCSPGATAARSAIVSVTSGTCASYSAVSMTFVGYPWHSALRWEPGASPGDNPPVARYGHVLAGDGAGGIVMHGGLGMEGLLSDVFLLRGNEGSWTEVRVNRW